jgi:hypothetical protein
MSRVQPEQRGVWDMRGFARACTHIPYLGGIVTDQYFDGIVTDQYFGESHEKVW